MHTPDHDSSPWSNKSRRDTASGDFRLWDHPDFQQLHDQRASFMSTVEKNLAHHRSYHWLQKHNNTLLTAVKEHTDPLFAQLTRDISTLHDHDTAQQLHHTPAHIVNRIYDTLVDIQYALVDTLQHHYLPHDDVSMKPLIPYLKQWRAEPRRLSADGLQYPLISIPKEAMAYASLKGALCHALFEQALDRYDQYTMLPHDRILDKKYQCDILAYHSTSNTYLAIDIQTHTHDTQYTTDYDRDYQMIDYLLKQNIIPHTHYQQGATLRHIAVNPLSGISLNSHDFERLVKQPKNHKIIQRISDNCHRLINTDYGFPW